MNGVDDGSDKLVSISRCKMFEANTCIAIKDGKEFIGAGYPKILRIISRDNFYD